MTTPLNLAPWPVFDEEMVEAASRVLASGKVNYWTGMECREFECEFAGFSDSTYAIALANGTIALEVALRALGIGPGDEVIVTPRSFVASASCVLLVGATPVFAEIDRDSGNLTPETIEAAITPRTKAVIVVHLGGWPAAMPEIMEMAKRTGLQVIEDCAQAHGAKIGGRSVGSFGHVSAWSFCQDKIITTAGEGGMVTTNCPDLYGKMWSLKEHGKSMEALRPGEGRGFRWLIEGVGNNGRMTEVQAAIGRVALKRLPEWTSARTQHAHAIMEGLSGLPIRFPQVPVGSSHAYYKLHGYLAPGVDRDHILCQLAEAGVPALSGSCSEIYREQVFQGRAVFPGEGLPVARELGESSLMFLVHPTLTSEQISEVIDRVRGVLVAQVQA